MYNLVFDTETSGLDPQVEHILEVGLIGCSSNTKSDDFSADYYNWYINPNLELDEGSRDTPFEVPAGAAAVNKITSETIFELGQKPSIVLEEATELIADKLKAGANFVMYNARFDLEMLAFGLKRYGLKSLADRLGDTIYQVVDPYCLDLILNPDRPGRRRLVDVGQHYGVSSLEALHTAVGDSEVTLEVIEAIFDEHPELLKMSPRELFDFQVAGYAKSQRAANEVRKLQGKSLRSEEWINLERLGYSK
jgi:DNA polymerase-3 subunit epsilon